MNSKVQLRSFNGTEKAPEGGRGEENYWALIGQACEILAPKNEKGRVLVKFQQPIKSFGLHCHNPIENTIYILESDLMPIQSM